MIATNKISMRLQTPPDANGNRIDIHPVTTTDEVIVDSSTEHAKTLTEKLEETGTIQLTPVKPAYPCVWAKPVDL